VRTANRLHIDLVSLRPGYDAGVRKIEASSP
jgi:hypothetical protein